MSDLTVGIDAPVAQERPAAADLFDPGWGNFANYNLFRLSIGLGDDNAKRVSKKCVAPEFDTGRTFDKHFVAAAVNGGDKNAIRDRV